MGAITRYLLIRDADGAILAEFDSPAAALDALRRGDEQPGAPGVSLVRQDDRQGEIVGTTSFVTARLADLGGRSPHR